MLSILSIPFSSNSLRTFWSVNACGARLRDKWIAGLALLGVVLANSASLWSADPEPKNFNASDIEFFESKVRPLLVNRCYECHSDKAKSLKGGLRLDGRALALKGGDSGPAIILQDPAKSLLLEAVRWDSLEMPPTGKLKPTEIEILTNWVNRGAPWPNDAAAVPVKKGYNFEQWRAEHWAYQPIVKPTPPRKFTSSKNALDQFVWAKLDSAGLKPNPPAEALPLIRRLSNDLRGIPPTPSEIEAFANAYADSPDEAVANWVDKYLESPRYGERWARHWLDVARYSDGHGGFLDNQGLPQAWRYRDWVVQAFNEDMPFADFIRMQIAGDLLAAPEGAIATGFFALGPTYRSDGGDPDSVAQAKAETLSDRIDTLSRGMLGLTLACARCHDHKFDPLPQQDYYSLAGVFNNSNSLETPLAPPEVVKAYNDHQEQIKQKQTEINQLEGEIKKAKREPNEDEAKKLSVWKMELSELRRMAPPKFDTCHALGDSGSNDMKVAIRGDLRKPGSDAPRRFLRVLAGDDRSRFDNGSGRLELAEAMCSSDNPLTPRVFVNRVWMHHFGRGIVATPDNFGALGEAPTHPDLLDWLTATFLEHGGSVKHLHRIILNSAAYRRSSSFDKAKFAKDGDNRWLWRMSPRRMDVESWRDSLLAVTGELDSTVGGPPTDQINSTRRTLYFLVSRNGDQFSSDRFLRLFDFPLMRATVDKRPVSIVPQQFLFLMNSDFIEARTRAFEKRLAEVAANRKTSEPEPESEPEVAKQIAPQRELELQLAYQLLYGRSPREAERKLAEAFMSRPAAPPQQSQLTPWQQYLQVLLCSNEFMFIP